jgi:hypothetical protein
MALITDNKRYSAFPSEVLNILGTKLTVAEFNAFATAFNNYANAKDTELANLKTDINNLNQTKKVAAYFTIAISTLHTEGISSEVIKMLDGYQDDTTSIPCFLIGQLGKSSEYQYKKIGEYILEDAIEIIDNLHNAVGGRFILLDAINIPAVVTVYQNSLFFPIETSDDAMSIKMIRPYFEEIE